MNTSYFFFHIFITALVTIISAATYYVAPDGNDSSGDGTPSNEWATISHALDNTRDSSMIVVREGIYTGRVTLRGAFKKGVVVRAEVPYRSRLRNSGKVITAYTNDAGCSGIMFDGFDIAHSGAGADALVVHIDGGGAGNVHDIHIHNSILHDSYNNEKHIFADKSATIEAARLKMIDMFGTPQRKSAVIDRGRVKYMAADDIRGNKRSSDFVPDIGCVELIPVKNGQKRHVDPENPISVNGKIEKGSIYLTFFLTHAATIHIELFTLTGKKVAFSDNKLYTTGWHRLKMQASENRPGIGAGNCIGVVWYNEKRKDMSIFPVRAYFKR
jgi:hypothetical protein